MPVTPAEKSKNSFWNAAAAGLNHSDSELSFMAVPTWAIPFCFEERLFT